MRLALAAALVGAISAPAQAVNGTWNVNASGAWTNAPNWVASAIADGANSNALFTFNITADRIVTLAADRTIGNITFTDGTTNSNNLTISGPNILTLDVTAGTPVINVTQTARSLTISSVIAGNDGLQKNGTGSLILSGNNTYTGVTRTNASGGTLQISLLANGGSNSSIGASSNAAANLLFGNASTFRYSGSTNVTTDRGFTINGTAAGHGATVDSSGTGTLSFDNTVGIAYGTANQTRTLTLGGTNTGNNTFGKVIGDNGTGAVTLAKGGTGKWILDQTNTYTGATRLNALGGTLEVTLLADGGVNSSIGASGSAASNLVLGRSTTLRYTGASNVSTNRSFTLNGTAAGHGATISSADSGTLSFTDNTVALAYGTANQTRTLTLNGTNTGNNTFGKILANNGTGATSLVKNDAGLWIVDQTNTYTGATTVSAGTLRAGAAAGGQAFGNLSAVTLANVASARLDLNGFSQTVGSLAGGGGTGGNVSLGSATLTTGGLNTSTSYGGVISGTGGLTKVGTGTQTLTRTNTYTGPTLITAGTLQVGSTTTGALSASSTITNNATLAFSRTNTLVVSNAIGGTGNLVKLATGTITLTGNNTYAGTTTISAGTLQLGNAGTTGVLSPSSSITNNGTLAFSRTNTITQGTDFASVIAGSGAVTKLSSGTLVLNGANSYSGATTITAGTLSVAALADGGATSSIGAASAAATNLLLVNNTTLRYTGTGHTSNRIFTINGTAAGNGATLDASGSGAVTFSATSSPAYGTANQTRTLTLTGTNFGNNTLAADIANNGAGAVSLVKSGTGLWVLSGNRTYTGTTTVSAGTLRLNGTHTGGGAYTINGAGLLQGTGATTAALSISGALAPGASVGAFGSGTLGMLAGSELEYEVDSSAALAAGADLAIVTGNLNLTGTVNLTLADLAGSPAAFADGTTFTLLNYSGAWNNGLLTYAGNTVSDGGTFTAGLNTWQLDYNAASGGSNFSSQYITGSYVNIVAVPEPGTFVIVAAAALGFGFLRRRK